MCVALGDSEVAAGLRSFGSRGAALGLNDLLAGLGERGSMDNGGEGEDEPYADDGKQD